MEQNIIYNAIRTPDGTIIESHHRHDYVTHIDAVTGETYMVDGGHSYLRRSMNHVQSIDLSVYGDAPFEEIRQVFKWGSYGKDGTQAKFYIALADMEDDHINAILNTQLHIKGTQVEDLFRQELQHRTVNS